MNIQFNEALDVDCDTFRDLAADQVGYSDGSRNTLDPEAMDEPLGVCKPDHPQHKPIDWNCNGVIDPGTVVDPVLRGFGTVLSDHDDYAALRIPPFAPQDRGEPKIDSSVRCPVRPLASAGRVFRRSRNGHRRLRGRSVRIRYRSLDTGWGSSGRISWRCRARRKIPSASLQRCRR